jgi:acetylornithine deacetylase/succinyl-diaminopimelate desuccinylase-like protein
MRSLLTIALLLVVHVLSAQAPSKEELKKFSDEQFPESIQTLKEFLSLPNYGRNEEQVNANAQWCIQQFEQLGFETKELWSGGIKHVFAEQQFGKKKSKTILFYLQIDGQPVDTSKWDQENPFQPAIKKLDNREYTEVDWSEIKDWQQDWRIFARSASDSKGPAVSFIEALKVLKKHKLEPSYNIKVIMDFQEELGSPSLPQLVRDNKELFSADAMLIMDGTRHPSNLPTLTFGARGIATIKLTVFGAYKDLHSGQYGNFAPNPVFTLAKLLGGMKDEDGRVLIPGFYDGVNLSEEFKRTINSDKEDDEALVQELGIYKAEKVGNTYQEALQYPSLNIRGMQAGWVEEQVRTIIPATATAEIDMRLVPETPGERQVELMRSYFKSKGFFITESPPTPEQRAAYPHILQMTFRIGSKPFRTNLDSELGNSLRLAMNRTFGDGQFITMQATGGSQPIAPFITEMNIPAISIRIPNPDNNIHAPNENLRLGNFEEGIRMCLGVLTQEL